MRLILIRHGESSSNRDGILTGRANSSLTERGKHQSEKVAKYLKERFGAPDELYSSPLKRALETARIISDKLSVPVLVDELLVEMDFGRWEGKTADELTSEPEWSSYLKDPFHFHFPEGETPQMVKRRMEIFKEKLVSKKNWETIIVVSHYTPIVFLILGVFNYNNASRSPFYIENASISIIQIAGQSSCIELLNYTPC
ncbi:MAG: histidine phosphatase family protein [Spirochaetota bacterium]